MNTNASTFRMDARIHNQKQMTYHKRPPQAEEKYKKKFKLIAAATIVWMIVLSTFSSTSLQKGVWAKHIHKKKKQASERKRLYIRGSDLSKSIIVVHRMLGGFTIMKR